MRSSYLIPCLVLILMNVHSGFSRIKARTSKSPSNKKPSSNIPKPNADPKPGQLSYKGSRLFLQFNKTDESEAYSTNHTMFPDALFYPRPSTVNDYEEFLGHCINTTFELETNKDKISKLSSDVNTRVTFRVIEFLCNENYNRRGNSVGTCSGGLWVVTIVSAMLLVMKTLY